MENRLQRQEEPVRVLELMMDDHAHSAQPSAAKKKKKKKEEQAPQTTRAERRRTGRLAKKEPVQGIRRLQLHLVHAFLEIRSPIKTMAHRLQAAMQPQVLSRLRKAVLICGSQRLGHGIPSVLELVQQ